MANIAKVSFFVFAFSLLSACAVVVMSLFFVSDEDSQALGRLLGHLGSFGSFLSGVATLIAASVAVVGVRSWIEQMKYGKYLNLIWDAKVSIRRLRASILDWYVPSSIMIFGGGQTRTQEDVEKKRAAVGYMLDDLKDKLHALDSLVVRNDWEMANKVYGLRSDFLNLEEEVKRQQDVDYESLSLEGKINLNNTLVSYNNKLERNIEGIEVCLNSLESKYGEG